MQLQSHSALGHNMPLQPSSPNTVFFGVNNKSCLFFKLPSLDNTLSSTAEQTNISDQPEWRSNSPSCNETPLELTTVPVCVCGHLRSQREPASGIHQTTASWMTSCHTHNCQTHAVSGMAWGQEGMGVLACITQVECTITTCWYS